MIKFGLLCRAEKLLSANICHIYFIADAKIQKMNFLSHQHALWVVFIKSVPRLVASYSLFSLILSPPTHIRAITLWIRELVFKDGCHCQSIIQSGKASLYYLLLQELEVFLGCDRTCPKIPVHDSWELAYFKNNILIHNETEKSQRNNKEVCYI